MAWLGFASRAQDVWVTVTNRHKTNLGTVFTTLHLSYNLLMGPKKLELPQTSLERLARDKRSSLLGPFVSYEVL